MREIMDAASVVAVIEIPALEHAAPAAKALAAGGLRVVEITLRTPCALDAIGAMKAAAPDLIVGMGTIRTRDNIADALSAGADFLVSPGVTSTLLDALVKSGASVLPGVATASEAMMVAEAGLSEMKFFPAETLGGPAVLKILKGPLPEIVFCPTGAISAERAPEYLALENVLCVGGSWIASKEMLSAQDWAGVEANARRAAAMKHQA